MAVAGGASVVGGDADAGAGAGAKPTAGSVFTFS